jgi:hypothetical protein
MILSFQRCAEHAGNRLEFSALWQRSMSSSSATAAAAAVAAAAAAAREIVVEAFALRQFALADVADFERKVNAHFVRNARKLADGYAPFCKHLFVPNWVDAPLNVVEITDRNRHLIVSEYQARTEQELPVLVRFIPKSAPGLELAPAKFLDLILYSREQLRLEDKAMGRPEASEAAAWGIVAIKPQDVEHELPMQPITMMRNALGKAEGGSGQPLDRVAYRKAVDFWSRHVLIL